MLINPYIVQKRVNNTLYLLESLTLKHAGDISNILTMWQNMVKNMLAIL